jgi:hypothetical protein
LIELSTRVSGAIQLCNVPETQGVN